MDTANRLAIALIGVVLTVGALLFLALLLIPTLPEQLPGMAPVRGQLQEWVARSGLLPEAAIGLAALTLIVGLGLLALSLRRRRVTATSAPAKGQWLTLSHDRGGSVAISVESARDLAQMAAAQVDGISVVSADVTETGRGIHALVRVGTRSHENLARVGTAVREAVKDAFERQLGVRQVEVHVMAHVEPKHEETPNLRAA